MSKQEFQIEQFKYSFQRTHFRKSHVLVGAVAFVGKKPLEDEITHSEVIGKNKSECKKLYGVGFFEKVGVDLGLGIYGNHVWLPQIDEGETKNKGLIIHVCLNCGSVMAANEFVGNISKDIDFDETTFKGVKK